MASEYILTRGPSREQLFDCTRLGPTVNQMSVVEFLGEFKCGGEKLGHMLPIEIEGVHYADDDGIWFFWGRLRKTSIPIWESRCLDFCFGRWDILKRQGVIIFNEKSSFFVSPLSKKEANLIIDRNS